MGDGPSQPRAARSTRCGTSGSTSGGTHLRGVDDACSHLIVKRQPAANDLRTVMATIKIITDLERIGDEATKIARAARALHERGAVPISHEETVRVMASSAGRQLHDALDTFARLDEKQATRLILGDEEIDIEYREIATEAGITNFRRVAALDTTPAFIKGLADLVQHALEGPEVNLDQAAELPTKVKLYPQDKWAWGWNNSSEVWNGRLAMVGFSAFLLELISGRGPLHALGLL